MELGHKALFTGVVTLLVVLGGLAVCAAAYGAFWLRRLVIHLMLRDAAWTQCMAQSQTQPPACSPPSAELLHQHMESFKLQTAPGEHTSPSELLPVLQLIKQDVLNNTQQQQTSSETKSETRPKSPPTAQKTANVKRVTFVVTDVEGSTKLWEWNAQVMDQSLAVHDSTLRALLMKHGGHEVTTEGDSFTVAFHDPLDAVSWCLSVQQALLAVEWPDHLSNGPCAEEVVHVPVSCPNEGPSLLFRGLRVRMGVATGSNYTICRHEVTGTWEYTGATLNLAEQISDAGYGGQVLICSTTSQLIYSRLSHLTQVGSEFSAAAMAPHEPVGAAIFRQPSLDIASSQRPPSLTRRLSQFMFTATNMDLMDTVASFTSERSSPTVGVSSSPQPALAAKKRPSLGRLKSLKKMTDNKADELQEMAQRWPSHQGSFIDTEKRSFELNRKSVTNCASRNPSCKSMAGSMTEDLVASGNGPLLVDMGYCHLGQTLHALLPPAQQKGMRLTLVLPPSLKRRLPHWPADLSVPHLTPSYIHAPGALESIWHMGSFIPEGQRPKVTIAFCSLPPETSEALAKIQNSTLKQLFCRVVRATLAECKGYECQEKEGVFMLAFQSVRQGLEWGLTLQLALLQVAERSKICLQEHTGMAPKTEMVKDSLGRVIFHGPRARVGMMHGEVIKISPHSRTGRADYFGQVLNRAARLHSAAHGGQVLADALSVDAVLQDWRMSYAQRAPDSGNALAKYLPGSVFASVSKRSTRSSLSQVLSVPSIKEDSVQVSWADGKEPALRALSRRTNSSSSLAAHITLGGSHDTAGLTTASSSSQPLQTTSLQQDLCSPRHSNNTGNSHYNSSSNNNNINHVSHSRNLCFHTIDVHDLGHYSMKGISNSFSISCVTPSSLSGRFKHYGTTLPTSKVTVVKRGVGLLDSVQIKLPQLDSSNLVDLAAVSQNASVVHEKSGHAPEAAEGQMAAVTTQLTEIGSLSNIGHESLFGSFPDSITPSEHRSQHDLFNRTGSSGRHDSVSLTLDNGFASSHKMPPGIVVEVMDTVGSFSIGFPATQQPAAAQLEVPGHDAPLSAATAAGGRLSEGGSCMSNGSMNDPMAEWDEAEEEFDLNDILATM